ncbi:MAG: hypothetical protein AAGA75_07210 [Cyanobacteria bacterium P01_E01_bin.6]
MPISGLTLHGSGRAKASSAELDVACRRCILPLDRRYSLERDATRILDELENLDRELVLLDEQVGDSSISEKIRRLRERVKAREDRDVIFRIGPRVYRIDRDSIKALPFGLDNPLLAYVRIADKLGKTVLPKLRQ